MRLFDSRKDFEAFQKCLVDTLKLSPMRLLGYCVMGNHWHLLLWPKADGELGRFMLRLTITHVRRWLEFRGEVGSGHVYQGRYKSFPIQDDGHLTTVCRYIERNPVRAELAKTCVDWPWSSAGQARLPAELQIDLCELPVVRRKDWTHWVDQPQTAMEEEAVLRSIRESRPFASPAWVRRHENRLGWREAGKPGRPRKREA